MLNRISAVVFDEVVSRKEFANRVGVTAMFLGIVWSVTFGLPVLGHQAWFKALFPH